MDKTFVAYIMGNEDFIENIYTLEACGVDYVEIGVPFTDPVADGPIIMDAGQEAIKQSMTLERIFKELKQHKDNFKIKYLLMTYAHTVEQYGENQFFKKCEELNVYGVIIPDMPEELRDQQKMRQNNRNVNIISLIAMTANQERIKKIAENAEGFVYTVTMNTTTGTDEKFHENLEKNLEFIKSYTNIPVFVGFGIKSIQDANQLGKISDGIIIGSEIVKRLKNDDLNNTKNYLKNIKKSLKNDYILLK